MKLKTTSQSKPKCNAGAISAVWWANSWPEKEPGSCTSDSCQKTSFLPRKMIIPLIWWSDCKCLLTFAKHHGCNLLTSSLITNSTRNWWLLWLLTGCNRFWDDHQRIPTKAFPLGWWSRWLEWFGSLATLQGEWMCGPEQLRLDACCMRKVHNPNGKFMGKPTSRESIPPVHWNAYAAPFSSERPREHRYLHPSSHTEMPQKGRHGVKVSVPIAHGIKVSVPIAHGHWFCASEIWIWRDQLWHAKINIPLSKRPRRPAIAGGPLREPQWQSQQLATGLEPSSREISCE